MSRSGKGDKIFDLYECKGEVFKYIGQYLNGEKNGKGKEYDGDKIFEGEYINGIKNGKGKENNYNGYLIFEREYLNDKRWNGKGYNTNRIIEFEIKNGKGKGKEYNDDGKLEYEGEYLNGERNRLGKEYEDDKLIFEGEYLNGQRWNEWKI